MDETIAIGSELELARKHHAVERFENVARVVHVLALPDDERMASAIIARLRGPT
jgi:hypothetical protein